MTRGDTKEGEEAGCKNTIHWIDGWKKKGVVTQGADKGKRAENKRRQKAGGKLTRQKQGFRGSEKRKRGQEKR